ncbi:HAD-IA family hydrolase [Candidatus Woesearchaeota archaeon]|nr:HAD-IA family hydrolase [Candidatus Woesearchaeota archaeon]
MPLIKALLSDAGSVILKEAATFIDSELKSLTNLDMGRVIETKQKYWMLTKTGRITDKEMWLGSKIEGYEQGVFKELGIPAKHYKPFIEKIREVQVPNEGAIEFLEFIKENNIPAYLLSNSSYELVEKPYKKFGFSNYFVKEFFSHKIGAAKPDKRFFTTAIKSIGVHPSEILFIDDKESNIRAAQELGMQTVLFESPECFNKVKLILKIQ